MKLLFISVMLLCLYSCTVEPQPIQYNYDECAYCKMKISDPRFGAELVTSKGKVFKYDSAECLVRTCIEENHSRAFTLVTDFSSPQTLIDAQTATFLISENQPSPMGGNLSAYENKELASSVFSTKGGELVSFENLIEKYRTIYK
jgi:copper chaperone NosL